MPERTIYRGRFVKETEKARELISATKETMWIPKSVFMYFTKDKWGDVKFSVETWKEEEVEQKGFKYE